MPPNLKLELMIDNGKTEVLTFKKGDQIATVVTDGSVHQTYEHDKVKRHGSLNMAISYLEAMGYDIVTDSFNGN